MFGSIVLNRPPEALTRSRRQKGMSSATASYCSSALSAGFQAAA